MSKTLWMKQSRQENMVYLLVWGMLFAAPLLSLYMRTVSDTNLMFDWMDVFIVWRKFTVYPLLFLIHNFLLAPLLIHGRKRIAYFTILTVMLTAFAFYQCNSKPERPFFDDREMTMGPPPTEMNRDDLPEPPKHHHSNFSPDKKPPIVGERDIMAILVLVLMCGANLGIKAYYRSREDQQRLAELEKQSLEQQLEYLRYQINPHFFMNTLNNIHALVDIDPAKAQETIVELSKMMRFILYEGDKSGVPLTKELEFIRTYVKLMQLRYTDKVRITLNLPAEVPDRKVPPLMLISFIENAFKHGISYQHESFVEVSITVEDQELHFSCRNSKADIPNQEKGGVGLANVRKRLNLLYAHRYTLHIDDNPDVYTVKLTIPLT